MNVTDEEVSAALHRIANRRAVDSDTAWRQVRLRTGPAETARAGSARSPRPVGRRAVLLVGAASVLSVALLGSQVFIGQSSLPASDAAVVLVAAAKTASQGQPAAPHQFVHIRQEGTFSGTGLVGNRAVTVLLPQVQELWLSVDGTRDGLVRHVYGEPKYLHPGDEQLLREAGQAPEAAGTAWESTIDAGSRAGDTEPAGVAEYRRMKSLPTDPDELYELVTREVGGSSAERDERTLDAISSMLVYATARPELRSALYEAAARIPGVTVQDTALGDGRRVRAVTARGPDVKTTVYFDAATSEVLRHRRITLTDRALRGAPAGTVFTDARITAAVVDALPNG